MALPIFNPNNPFELLDYTGAVNALDPVHGFISGQNQFNITPLNTNYADFDRQTSTTRVITSGARDARDGYIQEGRSAQNYVMNLVNYRKYASVTNQDIQNKRQVGSASDLETFQNVVSTRTTDMRKDVDESVEYLQFRALTGALPDGAGGSSDNMYDFLGLTASDYEFDMELDTASTNLNIKFDQLKREVSTSFRGGRAAGPIDVIVDYTMWEKMMTNADFQNAYMYFQSTVNPQRADLVQYYDWGVTEYFEHAGVRIFAYNPTFNLDNGSTATVLAEGTGIAMPRNRSGMFAGFYGPSTKVDSANGAGSEMYAYAWMEQNRERYNLEVQYSHLYLCLKPEAVYQLS